MGRIAGDVATNFITRWNHHIKRTNAKADSILQFATERRMSDSFAHLEFMQTKTPDKQKAEKAELEMSSNNQNNRAFKGSKCTAQIVRSIDLWSGGSALEQSVYLGMVCAKLFYLPSFSCI